MTTTRKISILVIIIGILSCAPKINTIKHDCLRTDIESEVKYEGANKDIESSFNDFNSNNGKAIDIIRILSTAGYDYTENFKRVYLENKKVFIYERSELREVTSINSEMFEKEFQNFAKKSILINCKKSSSQQNIYRYFVKIDNKLMMTFTSNDLIQNIDNLLTSSELKYITFFEKLK